MAIKYVFNPLTGNFDTISVEAAAVGGLYGINVEAVAANKTLTANVDKIYQYLSIVTSRTITLDTASATAGDRFVIRNTNAYSSNRYFTVVQNATTIDKIYAGSIRKYIFDGTNWVPVAAGSGESTNKVLNLAIGAQSRAYGVGVAIGSSTFGNTNAVAVGTSARGYSYGAAVGSAAHAHEYGAALGYSSDAHGYGVALGYQTDTNDKRYSTALGYYSECERFGELAINIGSQTDQENNMMIAGWEGQTSDATPIEIYCAGYGTNRFTIRAKSALTFKIMVTARDNISGDCAAYMFDGLIKRDALGNTTMSVCNKTVTHEDDATWDCDVTADDTNEALIITVTGDVDNTVQWAARLDGVETHF